MARQWTGNKVTTAAGLVSVRPKSASFASNSTKTRLGGKLISIKVPAFGS
jgi:hypothetical protein